MAMRYNNLGRTGLKVRLAMRRLGRRFAWRACGSGREPPGAAVERLRSSVPQVSAIGYGAWVSFGDDVDVPKAKELMQAAFDAGVN